MKKLLFMWMAVGALSFTACREDAGTSRETNENDSQTPDRAAGESKETSSLNYDYDSEYRERANRMATRVSQDLSLDTAAQARLRTLFYNRARQMDELEMRFSGNNQSAGLASDSGGMMMDDQMMSDDMATDSGMSGSSSGGSNMQSSASYSSDYPSQYYDELESINSNVDVEVKGFLTPQQFKLYETNRTKYYDMDMKYKTDSGAKMKVDGDEAKIKAGDTKIKRDGDEFKYESGDTKLKRDGDEVKYKSGDTKIKKDGNESKIKTENTKIKMEN
ncbi:MULTISPECIES: hypothetical protein [Rufibacter]|uniref:Lipoprotein n=1 Tax=Rufibacter quisquiliarum TaxID=1549639 RepID=A0A839GGG8_9BACT|nr:MULTISPECIES: hypothetical protein [Rufibacter]MBA9076683.1 hypothetical protein [Rufibacter quisquiliarum]